MGFRRFFIYGRRWELRIFVKFLKVYDFVIFYFFEGVIMRIGLLVIEKIEKIEFLVLLIVWNWLDIRGVDVEVIFEEVKEKVVIY